LWTRSSAASVWEIAVKASLGKLTLATTLEQLVRGGIERGVRLLDVTAGHAYRVEQDYTARLQRFDDSREARDAFLERRDPEWKWR